MNSINDLFQAEFAILCISSVSLTGKIAGKLLSYFKILVNKHMNYWLNKQPFIVPLLLISSYFFINHIGLPIFSSQLFFLQYYIKFAYFIEITRFMLTIILITKQINILFDWIKNIILTHKVTNRVLCHVSVPLRTLTIVGLVPLFLPKVNSFPNLEQASLATSKILLVIMFAWLIVSVANAYEDVFKLKHPSLAQDDFDNRSTATEINILKKILKVVAITLSIAISLLFFEKTRTIGASIFASAGIIAGVVSLAFRATLESFMCGLQIAFTQPIKLNDSVIIAGEAGAIEEISFSYVVVKLWDLRRLVVATKYFIENKFLNFSRNSTNIISSIFLYVNNTIPLEIYSRTIQKNGV